MSSLGTAETGVNHLPWLSWDLANALPPSPPDILIAPVWLVSALIPNLCPLYVNRWDKLRSLPSICCSTVSFFSSVVRLRIRLNADCRHESFRRGDERLLCTHEVIALSGVTDKGDSFCLRRWHRSWGASRVWLSIARWLVMLPRWCVCVWDVCVWNIAVSQTGCEGSWLSPHGYYVEPWMRPERRGGQDWREDSGGKQAGANILSCLQICRPTGVMAEISDSFSHWGIMRVYQSARGMLSSPRYRSFDKMDGGAKTGIHTFLKGQR